MSHPWNRRDFIVKPAAALAASHLLGGFDHLLGQTPSSPIRPSATSSKVICRTLGKTGITLPIVSMGVMNADVPGLIRRSYEFGVRHFDTAAHYQQGRNEQMVGSVIQEMGVRDKVTISTKILRPDFGRPSPGAKARAYTPTEVKSHFLETFVVSQKRLQMDYVDILYNHACDSEADINSEGALEALTQLKKEGKARYIGVSSHRPELALKLAMKSGVYDVVLITFNYTMGHDEGLLQAIEAAAKSGIGIVAMKTQTGGRMPPDRARNLPPESQTAMLKWVLQHESVTTAIPGYTRYEHLEQNFTVASNLTLTPEERDFLGDKKTVAEAQFCHQCGECLGDCPQGVDIPVLMRSHMYAVQYSNRRLAEETMASFTRGRGLDACANCETCKAGCRNSVDIAMKIQHLKTLAGRGVLAV